MSAQSANKAAALAPESPAPEERLARLRPAPPAAIVPTPRVPSQATAPVPLRKDLERGEARLRPRDLGSRLVLPTEGTPGDRHEVMRLVLDIAAPEPDGAGR